MSTSYVYEWSRLKTQSINKNNSRAITYLGQPSTRHVLLHCLMMETSSLVPRMISSHAWKKSPTPRQRLLSRPVSCLMEQPSSICWSRLHQRPLKSMHIRSWSHICLRSCKQCRAWIWSGILTLLIHWKIIHVQSGDKACGDVWWPPQPCQETGRTSYEWTATRPNCSGSSQQLSWNGLTRRTSKSSLVMERQCSASHYYQIWPHSPHVTMKRLTDGCCCMHLTQPSMDTIQYSSGL